MQTTETQSASPARQRLPRIDDCPRLASRLPLSALFFLFVFVAAARVVHVQKINHRIDCCRAAKALICWPIRTSAVCGPNFAREAWATGASWLLSSLAPFALYFLTPRNLTHHSLAPPDLTSAPESTSSPSLTAFRPPAVRRTRPLQRSRSSCTARVARAPGTSSLERPAADCGRRSWTRRPSCARPSLPPAIR